MSACVVVAGPNGWQLPPAEGTYYLVDVGFLCSCPSSYSEDCNTSCYESHYPYWKRDHNPETCLNLKIEAYS